MFEIARSPDPTGGAYSAPDPVLGREGPLLPKNLIPLGPLSFTLQPLEPQASEFGPSCLAILMDPQNVVDGLAPMGTNLYC